MRKLLLVLPAVLLAGCGTSTDALVEQIHSADAAQRLHAAHDLGDRRAEAAVPALAEALQDKDAFVRQEAARSLGKVGPEAKAAAPALLAALKDRKPAVRKAAAEALKNIDPEAADRAGVR